MHNRRVSAGRPVDTFSSMREKDLLTSSIRTDIRPSLIQHVAKYLYHILGCFRITHWHRRAVNPARIQ